MAAAELGGKVLVVTVDPARRLASALGLRGLATWMLEEARSSAADDVSILRALAEIYAEDRRYNQAIAILERLRPLGGDVEPVDDDVHALPS